MTKILLFLLSLTTVIITARASAEISGSNDPQLVEIVAAQDSSSKVLLVLHDGQKIIGKIISERDGIIEIETDSENLKIPASSVRTREHFDETTTVGAIREQTNENSKQNSKTQDVIVLKGGSKMRGKILMYDPLRVQLADSSLVTLNMADVISITRESIIPPVAPSRPPSARRLSPSEEFVNMENYREKGNSITLFGGMALPVGDFGESNVNAPDAGFAKSGFVAGIEWNSSGQTIQAVLGTVVSFNGSDFGAVIAGVGSVSPTVTVNVESGSWTGIWPMFGVRVTGAISPTVRIHGEGLLGALIGLSPEITVAARSTTGQSASVTIDRATGAAVAFGGGIGITISHFDLSVRYYAGSPEYEFKSNGQTLGKGKQPSSLVFVTVGISL